MLKNLMLSAVLLAGAGATLGAPTGQPTIRPCLFSQPTCRPADGLRITYCWDAQPMGGDYKVFVHFRDAGGKLVFQGDYDPPVTTAQWSGRVEHAETIVIPTDVPPSDYKIVAGLWNPQTGARLPLTAGAGVTEPEPRGYQIGILRVTADAPTPPFGPPTLNLAGYHLTFNEDFSEKELSVSAWGPGTRWIAHTPYAGDFGDARFADPVKGFPFILANGSLRIEAKKVGQQWQSGLLASMDCKGGGFAQQYGYFEMRAKFPQGPGTWPAFWLLGAPSLKDKAVTNIEIDVVEQYGVHPNALHTTVHLWYPDKRHTADAGHSIVGGMAGGFHRYGVMINPGFISFFFDGVELRRVKTPDAAKVPLYLSVDLALGGGWPIDKTPDPSCMYVKHVRAYAK